jgi:hypothetical protein
LALELDQANGDIIANRRAYLSSEFSWKPSTRVNQWQLTALENRITGPRLELLLGLERLPTAAPSLIEQVEPFDLWFEVTPTGQVSDDPNLPTSLHWLRTYDYPVPSYRVSVQNWPRDAEQQPQSATCKVWFNPQRQTPAGLTIQRGKDFDELSQLAQRSWDLRGDALRFEEIQVEMRSVLTANGDVETQPCLLIRIAHAGQVPVRVQPTGLKFAGEQHLHYRSLGKTTAMFWPVSEEQLANVLDGFAFISPVDLKERAEEDGYHAELKLGPASTDDIVFPPLVRRSAYD